MPSKKFSDFAKEEAPLDGGKMKVADIINKEITITAYKVKTSKYKKEENTKCLTLQFELDDNKYIFFTGSNVLIDQIEKYNEELPFLTTIKKIDKYYTFT